MFCSCCSEAPALWASNRRAAYWGGSCWVMRRIRPSSVLPGAAVNPNLARVSMTMPVDVAACRCARSRNRGCQSLRTSAASFAASAGRGVRIWTLR
ncbi:hypothetical protein SAMN04487982_110132 [Streptomyces sp. ok210]|nr:hypothetical protein SAMN04487982_110132 [Streptomyces sp. ok210]